MYYLINNKFENLEYGLNCCTYWIIVFGLIVKFVKRIDYRSANSWIVDKVYKY
jgi:hypothetical protein